MQLPGLLICEETAELARWLAEGPRTGEAALDFGLEDLDSVPMQLSGLRGRPVVLEFGSYTCPIFSDRVTEMAEALAGTQYRLIALMSRRGEQP